MSIGVSQRVYSRTLLLQCRSLVEPLAPAPWDLRPKGGLRELRLGSVDRRFEVCDLTRMWEALESLIVRDGVEIGSAELRRLPRGAVFETTGRCARVKIEGRGEIVRMEILLPDEARKGWITATSAGCGEDGRVYVGPPSHETIHVAGYSAFLLSHGRKFLVIDDIDVFPTADSSTPCARLHWGWQVQQFGLPVVTADDTEIRIHINYPASGWIIAKRIRVFFNAPAANSPTATVASFIRPFVNSRGEDMPTGFSGKAKALITMQLRAEVETAAPVVGLDLYEQRTVHVASPCILTDFVAGENVSQFIRMAVCDSRAELFTPRWATIGSVDPVTGVVKYFYEFQARRPPASNRGGTFQWNPSAAEFKPAACLPTSAGSDFMFPRQDGQMSAHRITVPIWGFMAPSWCAERTSFAYNVGQEVNQASTVFWQEETRDFRLTDDSWIRETVAIQWMKVQEGDAWLPLMEISVFTGKYLKYLKRLEASVSSNHKNQFPLNATASLHNTNVNSSPTDFAECPAGEK